MTTAMQKTECRTLSEVELDCVSGGTSGLIYAVAHAFEEAGYDNGCQRQGHSNGPVVCFPLP